MRVLITRPEPDDVVLKRAFEAQGHEVLSQPVLTIDIFEDADADVLTSADTIILTSGNGARALAQHTPRREMRVIAIGEATAQCAQAERFTNIDCMPETLGGDGKALFNYIVNKYGDQKKSLGKCVHVTGVVQSIDLVEMLQAQGFDVARLALYDAVKMAALAPEIVGAMRGGEVDGVLFYSSRTAKTFEVLCRAEKLEPAVSQMTAFCLSQQVVDALSLGWKQKKKAANPTQQAILSVIDL